MGKIDSLELLEPDDRRSWGRWLEEHHDRSAGVWVAVGKKGRQRTCLNYDAAVEEALRFGWIDSTVRRLDDDRFRQLFTPRRLRSTWSASNKERVGRLIAEGRMAPAGMAAVEAAISNGSWDSLNDVDDLVVPDDLRSALDAAPGARSGFDGINASQRKMILYWIGIAKRPSTRQSRIAKAVDALADGRLPI
jgi:uncharacterized protein YdeI (YjbR/CyaY-like superfamily)